MIDNPMLKQFASLLEKAAELREQMSELLSEQHLSPWWQDCIALHHGLLEVEQSLVRQMKQGAFRNQIENHPSWRQVEKLLRKAESLRNQMSAQLPDTRFATWLHEGTALHHDLLKAEKTFAGQLELEALRKLIKEDTHDHPNCVQGTLPLIKQMHQWLDDDIFVIQYSQDREKIRETYDRIERELDVLRNRMAADGLLEKLLTCADHIRGCLSEAAARDLDAIKKENILERGRQSVTRLATLHQSIRNLILAPQMDQKRVASECSKMQKELNNLENNCINNKQLERFYKDVCHE